jgi:hypothetical protein
MGNCKTVRDAQSVAAVKVITWTVSCYYTIMHRETFIEKLTEVQQTVEQLLAQLRASGHTNSRLTSTGRAGNTGQFANAPESPASKSSGA